jgi:hypothetical protein
VLRCTKRESEEAALEVEKNRVEEEATAGAADLATELLDVAKGAATRSKDVKEVRTAAMM